MNKGGEGAFGNNESDWRAWFWEYKLKTQREDFKREIRREGQQRKVGKKVEKDNTPSVHLTILGGVHAKDVMRVC